MTIQPDKYLEYLDKEMTIMGILSVFAVGLSSLVTDRIFAAASGTFFDIIRTSAPGAALAGAAAAMIAALFFYLQRSLLAWYYGQLALTGIYAKATGFSVGELLEEANGWDAWRHYQMGFIALTASFASYGYAVWEAIDPLHAKSIWARAMYVALLLVALLVAVLRWYVLTAYSDENDPFEAWRNSLFSSSK